MEKSHRPFVRQSDANFEVALQKYITLTALNANQSRQY